MTSSNSPYDRLEDTLVESAFSQRLERTLKFLIDDTTLVDVDPYVSISKGIISQLNEAGVKDVTKKLLWLLETTTHYRLGQLQNVSESMIAQSLFELIDYFEISPHEKYQVRWEHLFAMLGLMRFSDAHFLIKQEGQVEAELEKVALGSVIQCLNDGVDASSKAQTFKALFTDSLVIRKAAAKGGKQKTDKYRELKQAVFDMYIDLGMPSTYTSTAAEILSRLTSKKPKILKVLQKSPETRLETLRKWLSGFKKGTLKRPL